MRSLIDRLKGVELEVYKEVGAPFGVFTLKTPWFVIELELARPTRGLERQAEA